jgi:hypothetical protein
MYEFYTLKNTMELTYLTLKSSIQLESSVILWTDRQFHSANVCVGGGELIAMLQLEVESYEEF